MLELIATTKCIKYEAAPAGIDALHQQGIGLETGQPPYIPDLKDRALRRLW